MNNNNKFNIDELDLNAVLLKEQLQIPQGWREEVYFDKDTNEISFSSPLTGNTWTDSDDIVGSIDSLNLSDLEGWKRIDDEFVEVDDNQNETDPDFKDEEYERYYEDSSIITVDEAIDDRLSNIADEESWFPGIKEAIEDIKNGSEEKEEEEERYSKCDNCGNAIDKEVEYNNSHQVDGSLIWCCPCYHEKYDQCNRCEYDFPKDDLAYYEEIDGYVCSDCLQVLKEYET